eukprot:CAMPEP_0171136020 /NCGR_PEP_ID=MMETSP0766_2-20121228/130752_1 /TAXON_ID=439317 /ORGANISM="Gambierdiscus australes, Strain CAWD 149" /LENGTH=56 /DNA_ID=CAMNT_0011599537 /DNA_START=137 /DNA_END=304 /DNA_ORIENTATION=+
MIRMPAPLRLQSRMAARDKTCSTAFEREGAGRPDGVQPPLQRTFQRHLRGVCHIPM